MSPKVSGSGISQPRSICDILRVWEHGALVGEGAAIGLILAELMGLGKTASTIIAANTAGMRRVLVVVPKAALTDLETRTAHAPHEAAYSERHTRRRAVGVVRDRVGAD